MMGSPDGRLQTAIVTGGAGFVGSHLCERLLARGARVVCIDNLQTGSRRNLAAIIGHPNFSFIQHDIIERFDVSADRIYNLACAASPAHYQRDPVHTLLTCVRGLENVLAQSLHCHATVLQASTSEIYGDPLIHPQPESYWGNVNPIGVRSCYDEGKRAAEALCFAYARSRGARVKVARIFNTYGPRMARDDGRAVSNFITQALRGVPLTLYGEGNQTRSFCYVDDLVDGLIALMESDGTVTGPINLGNPTEITLNELAERIELMIASQPGRLYEALPSDDPRQRQPDIARAKTLLGWCPQIDLDEGLRRTISHFTLNCGNFSQQSG